MSSTKKLWAYPAALLIASFAVLLWTGLCCKHGARPRGVTQLGD